MEISRQISVSKFFSDRTVVDIYKPSSEALKKIEDILKKEKKVSSYTVYDEKNK